MNIDLIKGLAIISVILLHTWNSEILLPILAPYHIWQAVPIFMILLAYNNARSYKRRHLIHWRDFYCFHFMGRRFLAVLQPFLIVFILQIIFRLINGSSLTFGVLIKKFMTGGYGPGSYFIPLTLQAYLIMPLFYQRMRKTSPKKMLWGAGILNLIIELMCRLGRINEELYRILIIRFIFALALGIALSRYELRSISIKKWKPWIIGSAIYIYLVMYQNIDFIMEKYWHSQHLPGTFWAVFLIFLMSRIDFCAESVWGRLITQMGQGSFHIYLIQMFYFSCFQMKISENHLFIQALIDVVICIALGLMFFKVQEYLKAKNKSYPA